MNDLLTGQDALIARLEDENAHLRLELAAKDGEIRAVESQNAAAVKNLRRQLSPLYTALQQVFGEIDVLVSPEDAPGAVASGTDARVKAIWESWKGRLGPTCAKVIDALLLQPDMTNRQIAMAIGTGRIQTIYDAVAKMNKASLLSKNGDRYSLKAL